MSTLSITVPDDLRAAAEEAVASGRFATVSEYIAALIRQDQQRTQDKDVEALLLQRLQSGPAREMNDATFDAIRSRLDGEVARRRGA
jgi:antitoxin ParD1/3/4